MDTPLQQASTVKVTLGPFVSSTDGVTESTGLTPTVEVYKAGSTAWVTRASTVAVAHQSKGWYEVPLSTGDTDTLGRLKVRAHSSSQHLPVWEKFTVTANHVYGGLISTTDFLQTDAQQVGGATPEKSTTIADTFLGRNIEGSASSGRTVTQALSAMRNRFAVDSTGGTFTVYQTDDASTSFSGTVSVSTEGHVTEFDPD